MNFEKFGKYTLLRRLATGGMAEVFLAQKTGIAGVTQFVVVKRILPQYSSNKNFVEMFKNEGRITAHLKHSNLVNIQDFGEYQGTYFIEMEYLSGSTLKELMQSVLQKHRKFPIEYATYIIQSAASALEYIHESINKETGKKLGAIHRDISPHNIMVTFEGGIKVIDFGIAKIEDMNLTASGVVKGKFSYMSPEQIRGRKLDCRSDIFSLGAVFWELISGRKLFRGSNMEVVVEKVKECRVPPLKRFRNDVSQDLEAVILKSLTKDLRKRYSSASEMAHGLNQFLSKRKQNFISLDFQKFIKDLYADKIIKEREELVALSQEFKKREKKKNKQSQTIELRSNPKVFSEDQDRSFIGSSPDEKKKETRQVKHFSPGTQEHKTQEYASEENKTLDKDPTYVVKEKELSLKKNTAPQASFEGSDDKTKTSSLPREDTERSALGVDLDTIIRFEKAKKETYFNVLQKKFKQTQRSYKFKNTLWVVAGLIVLTGGYFKFQDEVQVLKEHLKPFEATQAEEVRVEEIYKSEKVVIEPQPQLKPRKLASNEVKKVWVETVPSGGTVFVNQQRIGKTPLVISLPVNSNGNSIWITKEGYQTHRVNPSTVGSSLKIPLTRKKRELNL